MENRLFACRLPRSRTSAGSAERARFLPAVCSVEKRCVKHRQTCRQQTSMLTSSTSGLVLSKRAKYARKHCFVKICCKGLFL